MATQLPIAPISTGRAAGEVVRHVHSFPSPVEMKQSAAIRLGDTCVTRRGTYQIVAPGRMVENGRTVVALESGLGIAVLNGLEPLMDVRDVIADTRTPDWFAIGDCIIASGHHCYRVAESGVRDHDLLTAGGVKLYVHPTANGYISAEALGCQVVETSQQAEGAADSAAILQAALERSRDIVVDGWVRIASRILVNGNRIVGSGRRQSGFWASGAAGGIQAVGTGTEIQSLAIESNFAATHLLVLGDGVQGSTNDCTFADLFVRGAKTRCLLVRENANGRARSCIFKQSGGRTGRISVNDHSAHTAEIRCIFEMIGCEVSAATGWALILVSHRDWEEARLFFIGGRIQTGYEGLIKVVGYSHRALATAVLDNVYFENPGVTGNPGVNNPDIEAAVVAQGPGALIDIRSYQKAACRRAHYFVGAYDGGHVRVPEGGPVKFEAFGNEPTGWLVAAGVAEAAAFGKSRFISEPGQLVSHDNDVYAPYPGAVPFMTTPEFDYEMWEKVAFRDPGEVVFEGIPPLRSGDSENFSLSDWKGFMQVPALINRVPVDFRNKALIRELVDGTSIDHLSLVGCHAKISNDEGDFLSGGAALELRAAQAVASVASISFDFRVTPDLQGQFLLITTAWAYKQLGDRRDRAPISQIEVRGVSASAFPLAGRNASTKIDRANSTDGPTPWYKAGHLFWSRSAGLLRYTHFWNTEDTYPTDVCVIDNVRLWAVRSHDFGSWV